MFSIYWQTNSAAAVSVPARCVSAAHERAREVTCSQVDRCRSHRKLAAHYLAAALTIHSFPTALASKAPVRGTVQGNYILGDRSHIR